MLVILLMVLCCNATAQTAGTIDYDTGDDRFEFYDGTSWLSMDFGSSGSGTCSQAGTMRFNSTAGMQEFCNGSEWRDMNSSTSSGTSCSALGEMDYSGSSFSICRGSPLELHTMEVVTIDVTPASFPSAWNANGPYPEDETTTISGLGSGVTITIEFEALGGVGSLFFRKNSGTSVNFTTSNQTETFQNGDTLRVFITGSSGDGRIIVIRNVTDSNTTLNNNIWEVP